MTFSAQFCINIIFRLHNEYHTTSINDKVNLGIGFLRDHNDNIQFLVYLVSI